MKPSAIFIFYSLVLLIYTTSAQQLNHDEIKLRSEEKLPEALATFQEFLAMPNDGHFPQQIATNLAWCDRKFTSIGFKTRKIVSGGVPHLYAEKIIDKKKKNILFYLQIDGQPVDSTKWDQESPFTAIIKDEEGNIILWNKLENKPNENLKIYARSASDSKGPATCFISALELMNEMKLSADFNIKVIMDFQEEMSSPTIANLVNKNRDLLNADYLLIMDGTRHISNLPTLTFGARGIATITLTVFGAKEDLHSGQYGNYAPNPAFKLARLLASMKDNDGRVLIDSYYDGIEISEADKAYFDKIPEDMGELNERLGIAKSEAVANGYQATMQYPSLNIRGMGAGWIGKGVRTLIPATATAEIDLRLVPETDGDRMIELVRQHLTKQGAYLVDAPPTDEERAKYPTIVYFKGKTGSKPFRTEINSEIGDWLGYAMDRATGENNYVKVRATGGSQPMASFIETLDVPAVSIRIPNPDNNIHAPNENIRIGNFLEGIQMCLGILTQPLK
ncbi:MAG: acetylornithine deacetylase/succinyl-diaminopimelate desuccinylase-like protein [Spirosomataceae bacterium]|jgi:acetylornithine deacetylase/succinyl-diaminopimelate desuccinylase-like protein